MTPPRKKAATIFFLLALLTLVHGEPRRGGGRSRLAKSDVDALVTDNSQRRGKLFSLFNIVTFQNLPCATTSVLNGVTRNGTCLSSTECASNSGQAQGNCAAGFGVCCLFVVTTAGATVSQNCTYLQNEGFPSALAATVTSVQYTVQRVSNDVCLLRLDFGTFEILGTNGFNLVNEGACLDTFTVTTPTMQVVPVICGDNTGQHMYVDIGSNSGDTATLAFMFDAMAFQRMWDIKVNQIECTSESSPRDKSCLQFHIGLTGRIESFNFNNGNDNHLNGQQYSVCIRQEEGFCCVEFAVCPDQVALDASGIPPGFSFDTRLTLSAVDNICTDNAANSIDHISIPGAAGSCFRAGQNSPTNNRYCGTFLNFVKNSVENAPVCDCTGPFRVDVFFGMTSDLGLGAVNTKQSRGLCLEYMQIPC